MRDFLTRSWPLLGGCPAAKWEGELNERPLERDGSRFSRAHGPAVISTSTLSDRRGLWAFILGVTLVTAGVLLHLPMFLMGRLNRFHLYGMPMGADMYAGMGAIILGVAVAAYGLLPRNISRHLA